VIAAAEDDDVVMMGSLPNQLFESAPVKLDEPDIHDSVAGLELSDDLNDSDILACLEEDEDIENWE
jgi:hypothetical protein